MWHKFFTRDFPMANLGRFRHKLVVLAVAVGLTAVFNVGARGDSKDWIVLNNCRLIASPANDGDSFHVSVGANEYLFRLYLVDAPETDEMIPGRLVEQARYFGITVPQAIEVGRAAKEFARQKLSEPFTAFTHLSDAMGQSRIERFYAYVQTKDGDLGEQLVRNGLARIYGFKATPPGSGNLHAEMQKLREFENQARQEKVGAWGMSGGRLPRLSPLIPFSTPNPYAPTAAAATPTQPKSHPKAELPLGRIDVNTATEKELRSVPGIGPVIAARIIAARPFRSADDLKKVSGIGDKNYARIRPYFQ
jgi:endonuclease YncB( thermonuclease family)